MSSLRKSYIFVILLYFQFECLRCHFVNIFLLIILSLPTSSNLSPVPTFFQPPPPDSYLPQPPPWPHPGQAQSSYSQNPSGAKFLTRMLTVIKIQSSYFRNFYRWKFLGSKFLLCRIAMVQNSYRSRGQVRLG